MQCLLDTTEKKLAFLIGAVSFISGMLYALMQTRTEWFWHPVILGVGTCVLTVYSSYHECADFWDELEQRALGTIVVTLCLLLPNQAWLLAMLFYGWFYVLMFVGFAINGTLHGHTGTCLGFDC